MKRIFNSVGSNYTLGFALRALTSLGDIGTQLKLRAYLEERYGGKAELFYKGREALEYGLRNSGLPEGSKIIVSGYTCAVVIKAIEYAGYKAVYADIGEHDLNFSLDEVKRLSMLTRDVKAIIIQNTLGYTCDIAPFEAYAKDNGMLLIEDLAHSVGGTYPDGRETGTVGDMVMLSFSQDKVIDAVSGGALVVRNKKIVLPHEHRSAPPLSYQLRDRFYPLFTVKIRATYGLAIGRALHALLRRAHMLSQPVYTLDKKPFWDLPGSYAELVLYRFKNLSKYLAHRRTIAEVYLKEVQEMIPFTLDMNHATALRVPLMIRGREGLIAYMKGNGVYLSDVWYDVPIAPKKYWSQFEEGYDLQGATVIAHDMVNLPTSQTVRVKDAQRIGRRIQTWNHTDLK